MALVHHQIAEFEPPATVKIKIPPVALLRFHVDVSENSGTPKSSILIGFSIINHPFWGTPYFWKHPYISVTGMAIGVGSLKGSHDMDPSPVLRLSMP